MKPERLKENRKEVIKKALIDFYQKRPDEYGMIERSEKVYNEYTSFIAENLSDKNKIVLDFGSGSWRIPEAISKKGFKKVIGLDYFSEEKLNLYRSKIDLNNVELITYLEPGKIPLNDNSVDVVTSLCVFEHIIDVKENLDEIKRVLKPGGYFIAEFPNWSSILVSLNGIKRTFFNKDRFWLLNNFSDSFFYFFRTIKWYFEALFTNNFIMIEPRLRNDEINFERSDDDVVHVCQPISFKNYFKKNGFNIIKFNSEFYSTRFTKYFNTLFPNFASSNKFVIQKK